MDEQTVQRGQGQGSQEIALGFHHRALPVWKEFLPKQSADRSGIPNGAEVLVGTRQRPLGGTNTPIASSLGRRPQAFRRCRNTQGHDQELQRAKRYRRGTRNVLERHRAILVVVPRPDRDPSHDDRSLRRSRRGYPSRRGVQSLVAQAKANPGLENHQSHGRCSLCFVATRRKLACIRRARSGRTRRNQT